MDAAKAFLKLYRRLGIILGKSGPQHLLEGDAHALGDCRRAAENFRNIGHRVSSRVAQNGVSGHAAISARIWRAMVRRSMREIGQRHTSPLELAQGVLRLD